MRTSVNWWPNCRLAVLIAVAAIPMEALATHLLSYAPRIGVPRDPSSGLRFWGAIAAVYHAPALLLNDFVCRRLHVPASFLWADLIVSGYLLSVVVVRFGFLFVTGR